MARVAPGRRGDRDDDFGSFVAASSYRLLRTAYRLTGDRGAAEQVLERALARTYRHWRRASRSAAPEDYAHRAVVSAVAGRGAAAPGPEPASLVPDRDLADRVRSTVAARRRRSVAGAVAAALVVTGGTVAAAARPHHRATVAARPPAPTRSRAQAITATVTAVAATDALLYVATTAGGHARLAAYDRGTGAQVASADLPGSIHRLAAGHGSLWVSFDPRAAELSALVWHMAADLGSYDGQFVAPAAVTGESLEPVPLPGDRALLATEMGVLRLGLPSSGQLGAGAASWVRLPHAWRAALAVPLGGDAVAVLPVGTGGLATGTVVAVDAGRVVAAYGTGRGRVSWIGPASGAGLWAVVATGSGRRLVRLDGSLRPLPGGLPLRAGSGQAPWVADGLAWVGAGGDRLRCVGASGTGVGTVGLGTAERATDVAVADDVAYVATAHGLIARPVPVACRA
ncbi:MAG: hypothetical protein ACJ74O_01185 [Frankiaceae bacterium]